MAGDSNQPCHSQAASAFARASMAGTIWGLIYVSSYEGKESARKLAGSSLASRTAHVASHTVKNGLGWGGVAGAYVGMRCGLENIRGQKDLVNPCIAGFLAGCLIDMPSRQPKKIFARGLGLSIGAVLAELYLVLSSQ